MVNYDVKIFMMNYLEENTFSLYMTVYVQWLGFV